MSQSSHESSMDNPVPDGALQDLGKLQVKHHQLQTQIMTLLAEQRHDLDTMTKMAGSVKYTVEEAQIDGREGEAGWRNGFGALLWA